MGDGGEYGGRYTSSSISKRVKPPYLDCWLLEGGDGGWEEEAMVVVVEVM